MRRWEREEKGGGGVGVGRDKRMLKSSNNRAKQKERKRNINWRSPHSLATYVALDQGACEGGKKIARRQGVDQYHWPEDTNYRIHMYIFKQLNLQQDLYKYVSLCK